MTLDELEKKLSEVKALHDELKAQFDELKAQNEEKPKPPYLRWKPEHKEHYYIVWCSGAVEETYWANGEIDNGEYSIGNVFRTKEEAEFAAERLKVLAEIREWSGKWNDGFVLVYIGNLDVVSFSDMFMFSNSFGEMRFATEKDAENCIKAVGADRIKKYYFMIPEGKEEYRK